MSSLNIGRFYGDRNSDNIYDALVKIVEGGNLYPGGAADSVVSTAFTTSAVPARIALPATQSMRVHATADCWIAFGDSTITVDGTTGIFFASGTEMIKYPSSATHVAVRGVISIGALNLTGMTNDLRHTLGTTVQLAYTAATNDVALPTNGGYIRVYTPTDCYITFGVGSATSSTTTGT